ASLASGGGRCDDDQETGAAIGERCATPVRDVAVIEPVIRQRRQRAENLALCRGSCCRAAWDIVGAPCRTNEQGEFRRRNVRRAVCVSQVHVERWCGVT